MRKASKNKKTKSRTAPGRRAQKARKAPSLGSSLVKIGGAAADTFLPGSGSLVRGIGKLFGYGAYTREGAETYLASAVPAMHSTLDNGIRVTHKEYLGDVSSSTLWTLSSYPINPGMAKCFPWLSTLASAFQKWEDNGIVFYFKSTSASALNSTNTALGTVSGAVTYNPYQAYPSDKVIMLGLSGVQTGKPAEDNLYPVECKMSRSLFATKLVRVGGVDDDLAKYDAGVFHLASYGSQATAVIGELYVVYDITLKEPKLGQSGWTAHFRDTHYDDAMVIKAETVTKVSDSIGVTFSNPTASSSCITFSKNLLAPKATYKVDCTWGGTEAKLYVPPAAVLGNGEALHPYPIGDGSYWFCPASGANTSFACVSQIIRVLDTTEDMTWTLGNAVLPGAGVCDIFITELDHVVG